MNVSDRSAGRRKSFDSHVVSTGATSKSPRGASYACSGPRRGQDDDVQSSRRCRRRRARPACPATTSRANRSGFAAERSRTVLAVDNLLTAARPINDGGPFGIGTGRGAAARRKSCRTAATCSKPPDRAVGTYSGGMRRRLDFGDDVVGGHADHSPDEPTTGSTRGEAHDVEIIPTSSPAAVTLPHPAVPRRSRTSSPDSIASWASRLLVAAGTRTSQVAGVGAATQAPVAAGSARGGRRRIVPARCDDRPALVLKGPQRRQPCSRARA